MSTLDICITRSNIVGYTKSIISFREFLFFLFKFFFVKSYDITWLRMFAESSSWFFLIFPDIQNPVTLSVQANLNILPTNPYLSLHTLITYSLKNVIFENLINTV